MTKKFKKYVFDKTNALIYYNRQVKAWCAYWLSPKSQNCIFFGKSINQYQLVNEILEKQMLDNNIYYSHKNTSNEDIA